MEHSRAMTKLEDMQDEEAEGEIRGDNGCAAAGLAVFLPYGGIGRDKTQTARHRRSA
jgi:hypothetical protein